jgi:L-iditol 2-dehydrogenase
MKSLFIGPRGVVLKEVEKPSPKKGEILIEMRSCGVCGTDLEKVKGEAVTPPVLGHEVVGEVAEVGRGVGGINTGDRVFTHHHAPCYECELCRRGEYTLCAEFPRHNINPGGFSEYYVVPAWNVSRGAVLPLPDSVSFEEGSFIEPLGCCIRGLSKVNATNFMSAIIYGAGPVGLTHLMLLQHYGYANVVVGDFSEYRLSFASRLGAKTFVPGGTGDEKAAHSALDGVAPELAIVATGSSAAFLDAMKTVSPGGRVLLFGAPPRSSKVSLDLSRYFLRGITVQSSYSTSEKETALAVKMLESGAINLSKLITHRFGLEDAPEAFRVAGEQKCVKAIVNS